MAGNKKIRSKQNINKKNRSLRQALEKCEAKSFYGKINLVHPSIAVG